MSLIMYLLVGAAAGLLAGLFGIGGGMVIVPVLIFSFLANEFSTQVLTHMAVATSLASICFTSLGSIWEHHQKGAVIWSLFQRMLLGLIIGTSIGVFFITSVPGPILQKLIGLFALLLAIKMFLKWQPKAKKDETEQRSFWINLNASAIGFGSSWFGIGGGTFVVPYLTWLGVSMKKAVATSAACGLPIALTATVANVLVGWNHEGLPEWSTGFVYWPAVLGIALTSVPFARLGAKLAHRLDTEVLKTLFAVLLCVVGIRFLLF